MTDLYCSRPPMRSVTRWSLNIVPAKRKANNNTTKTFFAFGDKSAVDKTTAQLTPNIQVSAPSLTPRAVIVIDLVE